MALCKTTVMKVYSHVIDDVIAGVRDVFTDEGLDEHVLLELKGLWETKLLNSRAVEPAIENPDVKGKKPEGVPLQGATVFNNAIKRETFNQVKKELQQQQLFVRNELQTQQQNNTQNQVQTQNADDKMIPIQITLPIQPTIDAVTRVLTIHVPASALNGQQLHSLLTGPVITSTMGLPAQVASSLLQDHVNAALSQQQQQQLTINKIVMPQMDGSAETESTAAADIKVAIPQTDGSTEIDDSDASKSTVNASESTLCKNYKKSRAGHKTVTVEFIKRLVDGGTDTSDEEEDASEDDASDDEIDEEKEDEDAELDDGAPEEEPLNSEDDVTDEEPSDLFDTDNVVVCQYDKITRSRNKWKFYLKDGIMNLDGEDFVFQKANGDAEW